MDKIKLLGLLLLIFIGINYVEGQRLCHSCDSRVNPNCASLQDTRGIATITCGSCSQWIVGEATFRGCDDSIPKSITQTWVTCFYDLCNIDILPRNRHKCRQCSSDTDQRCDFLANLIPETACTNLRAIDECFTVVAGIRRTHRGCMSDAPTTPGRVACTANNNYCFKCSSSGCNTEMDVNPDEDPFFCVSCNSATNLNCATEVNGTLSRRCSYGLLGRKRECYTFSEGATTIRGCTNDAEALCDTPNANCLTCGTINCNVEDYCLVCSTEQDENCRANTRSLIPQLCARNGAQNGCYRRELPGDVVQRGCASTLDTVAFATCSSNSAECKICHGEACNMKEIFQTCFACDSRTFGNCARADSDTPLPTAVCDDYMDTCRVWILPEEGATLRGCSGGNGNDLCSPTNPNCEQCEGSFCNRNLFPANRRRCYRCSGEPSCQGSFAGCDLLDPEASCYLVLNSQNQVVRGCTTDVSDGMDLCRAQGDRCVKCSGDNCNYDPATVWSFMSCITCNSSLDEACAWGIQPNPTNSERCVDQLPLGTFETCYVHIDRTTNRIERGCRSSNEVACASGQCEECTGFDCNNQNVVSQTCLQCRSSIFEESTCSDEEYDFQIPATPCTSSFQPFETRGCYVTEHNGNTVRGCLSDLDGRVLRDCLDGRGSCRPCQGQGCNAMGGNGNTIKSFSFVTFVTFFVVSINILN